MLRAIAADVNAELTMTQTLPKGRQTREITVRFGRRRGHDVG